MDDFLVFDISPHLAASKRSSYRAGVLAWANAFVTFLQEKRLSTRDLLAGQDPKQPTFKVMRSDLTDEGYELVHRALDRWLKGIARGQREPEDVSYLSKVLEQIRAAKK